MLDACPRLRDIHPDLRDLVREHCLGCHGADRAACLVRRMAAEVQEADMREPFSQRRRGKLA